jgi:hypothetical protein
VPILTGYQVRQSQDRIPFAASAVPATPWLRYGPVWGSIFSWTGAMLGASAAFGLVRLLGRPFLYRALPTGQRQRFAAWSDEPGGGTLLDKSSHAGDRIQPDQLCRGSDRHFLVDILVGHGDRHPAPDKFGDRMLAISIWAWLVGGSLAALGWMLPRRWRGS